MSKSKPAPAKPDGLRGHVVAVFKRRFPTHSPDGLLCDPDLANDFVGRVRDAAGDQLVAARDILKHLLRARKAGQLKRPATAKKPKPKAK